MIRDVLTAVGRVIGLRLVRYAIAFGFPFLLLGVAWIGVKVFQVFETRLDVVNATAEPLTISIDGKVQRTAEPGASILTQPWPGTHRFVARNAAGAIVEQRDIAIGVGSAQIWNVRNAARFAIVARTKTPDFRDIPDLAHARRYDPPGEVFAYPPPVTLEMVDFNFRMGFGSAREIGDESVRLCTLTDDRVLGCEACQRWDDCAPIVLPAPLP